MSSVRRVRTVGSGRAPWKGLRTRWKCDWQPDELNTGLLDGSPGCPYCAGEMCARFDGLGCTHDRIERHGYLAATPVSDDTEGAG